MPFPGNICWSASEVRSSSKKGTAHTMLKLVTHPQHDRDLAKFPKRLRPVSIVDPILNSRTELPTVRRMPFSALGRVDIAVASGILIRRGNSGFLEEDFFDSNMEFIPPRGFPALRKTLLLLVGSFNDLIEESLGANVFKAGF